MVEDGAVKREQEIFERIMDLPREERAAAVDAACGADAALKAEVSALLDLFDHSGNFMGSPTGQMFGDEADSSPLRERPGTVIGRYKLQQQIGEGGFGVVFVAEQSTPVNRRVALKVIKLGMDTRQVIARFEQERQVLAIMDHPGIARVLDAGATDTGRPYFVMELCTGDSITKYADREKLSIPERLQLFTQVCHAVQHAHQKGVIHRDIKPSNILVSTQDGQPHAKIIDFGIAKATASKLTEMTLFTEQRLLVGTPEYMSPEQIAGEPLDARSDLYSLALVAFQGLTGAGAFPDTGSMESLILRLTSRPRTLIEVRQSVSWPPKMQTVFDKALAPQREERHASVVEFASDLSGAIVTMSPSETQAFYRRALESRSVNPVALTPSATPAKPSKEKARGKTAAAPEEKAAAPQDTYRPMGMPGRPTQRSYDGPTVRKTNPWRLVLLVGAVFVGIAYWDDNGVVAAKFDGWGVPAVTSAFNKIREFGKKEQLRQAGMLVDSLPPAPVAPTKSKASAKRPVAKADTTKKPDTTNSSASAATPPKPDSARGVSGTVPPPPF